ncbi:MAG: TauD/TfdA family dioxygenase [Cyanobacteria bacterium J06626_23]
MAASQPIPSRFPKELKARQRRPITLSSEALVQVTQPDKGPPVVIQATEPNLGLTAWGQHQSQIRTHLQQGGILFRGFQVQGAEDFGAFLQAIAPPLMTYTYGSTPRSVVQGQVYTSTEYPSNRSIPLHNEMAYTRHYPLKIAFHCVQPAQQGGETPIADSRRVLARLPLSVRARFEEQGVLYIRNYGGGLDLPWQAAFQTDKRAAVEAYCRRADIEFEWWGDDQLQTRQVAQAIATHPATGETVWFNQAHLFHVSSLDPDVRHDLLSELPPERLPRNAYYGDGSPIADATLAVIREAYQAETIRFPWQAGDVLLLDNLFMAHGRQPYVGARRVLAAMAQPSDALSHTIGTPQREVYP